jgi:transcriptional regulator with XRE-family HTH domain
VARPLLRGERLHAAREAMGLAREGLAAKLELSSPARILVWEAGLTMGPLVVLGQARLAQE